MGRGARQRLGLLAAAFVVAALVTAVVPTVAIGTPLSQDRRAQSAGSEPDPLGYTSFQGGPAHLGFNGSRLGRHLTRAWTFHARAATSTPLVVGNRVFVSYGVPTENGSGQEDSAELVALSARTGRKLWGPVPLHRSAPASPLAYLDGTLFTNSLGIVQAWNPVTGSLKWATHAAISEETASSYDAIAAGDDAVVVLDPLQQAMTDLDPATGAIRWVAHDDNFFYQSMPSISAGVVSIAAGCEARGYSLKTGVALWRVRGPNADTSCPSGNQAPPPIHAGAVYVMGTPYGIDVAPKTGKTVRSDVPGTPSYAGKNEYWISSGALHGVVLPSEPHVWSTLDRHLAGLPFVAGRTVIAGSGDLGRVSGYATGSGRRLWTMHPPAASQADPQEIPSASLVVGDGTLLVDNSTVITAYQGVDRRPPAANRPAPAPMVRIPSSLVPVLGTSWTGVYGDVRNDDDNPAEIVGPPYQLLWTADIGLPATPPVILPGGVFVLVDTGILPGARLYGFSTATGLPLWPPVDVPAVDTHEYLTASDGVLVVDSGFLETTAVSAATGTVLWSHDDAPEAPPLAIGGVVIQGTLVTDLLTGADLTQLVTPLDDYAVGMPVFANGYLFMNGSCDRMYRFSGTNLDWAYTTGCYGGSLTTLAYEQGRLIGEGDFGDKLVHSPATGQVVGALGSSFLPTSAGNTVFVTDGPRIVAEHKLTNRIDWTYKMPAHLARPVEVTGHTLLAIDRHGDLVALDAITGQKEWSTTIAGYSGSLYAVDGGQGLAAAQGVLVVPTGRGVTVLRGTGGVTDLLPPVAIPPTS
ncbi:MAG TPA: PQQ-binding-like beta-propeller repeat protein [Mycobacteriales bacterium]|nr:PQQ-binding-like beta-propeller repeat protein [Mycobacteriales bacterium]